MSNERFVIITRRNDVSVVDTECDNLELLGLMFEDNEEAALYLAEELKPIVRLLNEQDKELKKVGVTFP